jgi:hypothetical protein
MLKNKDYNEKRRTLIILFILLTLVGIGTIKYINKDKSLALWKENAIALGKSFDLISGDSARIDDLRAFIPFEWARLYSFDPYYPKEKIYEVIGFEWSPITETVSEGMNQLIFLKDKEVVCYVYGYPDRHNFYLYLGPSSEGHVKLSAEDSMVFDMTVEEIYRYLELVNQ